MSDESHIIPDEMVSRTARLINAAEDMRQQAADDLKQIYRDMREELKALGWNGSSISAEVAAFKGAIAETRLDEKSKDKREARSERIDDYVSLLTRARARGSRVLKETHERPSTNDKASPEAGPQAEASPAGTGTGTLADREGRYEGEAASVDLPANPEMDRDELTGNADEAVPAEKGRKAIPASPEGVDLNHAGVGESPAANSDQPLIGGDHEVDGSAMRAGQNDPTSNSGEEPRQSSLPVTHKYRPNCQHRDHCRSGTRDHCYSCRVAMREDAA